MSSTRELEPWVTELSLIPDEEAQRAFLARYPHLPGREAVDRLYEGVVLLGRVDLQRAGRLAEASVWLAARHEDGDAYVTAQSARALGHVSYLRGRHREAIQHYQKALALFESLGRDVDAARTINGALLQSLSYDGQYDRVFRLEQKARAIFQAHGDQLRLARLDSNMANILYRQDRFEEAVELYERARQEMEKSGEALDIAIVLRNMVVCYITLNDFDRAQEVYEAARSHCERHDLPLLIVEADYNIAYLYYLRGEYLRAIDLYDTTRNACRKLDDKYHRALCDLDESEIYLELNLTERGEDLAREAFLGFSHLDLKYEAAKAATFCAIAISQQGHHQQSLRVFDDARELFVREQNHLWPSLIDLYKALVLCRAGQDGLAHGLAASALEYFASSPLPAKAAICELLLAGIGLRAGATEAARRYCHSALERLSHIESPAVYQAYFVLGQVEEAGGHTEGARQAYEKAYQKLEELRSHLGREELKIAFLKNKLAVYEGLVVTSLALDSGTRSGYRAFEYIEQAKSRSLADLIAFRASSFQARTTEHAAAMEQLRGLRLRLNWVYHQVEMEELSPGERPVNRIERLRAQGREFEDSLMRAFSQFQGLDREFVGLQNAGTVSVEEIQSRIPPGSILMEYYEARDIFYACLVSRDSVKVFPVAPARRLREHLRLLQLQLAKFRLGEDYVRSFEQLLLRTTQAHLQEMYSLLIAPLRKHLEALHLIIVPHGFLHYLPFHALCYGDRYLIDDYSISYAPSGSVFALCQAKPASQAQGALVLAVPDARAPAIRQEAEFVAAALGEAKLFIGEEATEERLRAYGPQSRCIHIATHGYFRRDNPMFSSIRLGASSLSLFDLYELRLNAELVTLSGCGTGMNVVVGGDELIGLVRGLLYAGAQTLLVSLWEIHDQSTAELMRDFYRACPYAPNKAMALRDAMLAVRKNHPHPYHWAGFLLVGKVS